MPQPKHHVLVCLNSRPPGHARGCCAEKGAEEVWNRLKAAVSEAGLGDQVMVTRTGCLKHCSLGVTVAVHPDNVWYRGVTPGDVAEILASHLEGSQPVKRLLMPDIPWE